MSGQILKLMDAGMSFAARVPADVRIGGRSQDFDLPLWRDESGDIRIGLPKFDPQHGSDFDQIVLDLGDLLEAIARALP
jgi:hypothetical protein